MFAPPKERQRCSHEGIVRRNGGANQSGRAVTRRARRIVAALADTGSVFLCIPEPVRLQLKLEALEHREVELADGSRVGYPYVGPPVLRFKNRTGFVGALVLGDEVLLGAIAMQEMDLVANPRDRTVDVNPDSPNIATGICKRAA
jgi:hypothetical protein